MLWFNNKERVKLKEEIKKLKEERNKIVKEKKQELKEIKEEKDKELEEWDNLIKESQQELNKNKEEQKRLDKEIEKAKFLETIYQNDNNINKYVSIELDHLSLNRYDEFNGRRPEWVYHYLYIYLSIENLSPYRILSTEVSFDIYNLLGTKLVDDFSIESSRTIKQDKSIVISSNGVLRYGTTYDKYHVNPSFINRYELETLIDDRETDKLVLKVKKLKLVLDIDGENKIININFFKKVKREPKKNNLINNKDYKNNQSEKDLFKIELLNELNKSKDKTNLILKTDTYNILENEKKYRTIKYYLKDNISRPVLTSYSPLKMGGIVITNSYTLYHLKCNYLPNINICFTKEWQDKEKQLFLKKYNIDKSFLIQSDYPNTLDYFKNIIFDDEIIFKKKEIFNQVKEKEKTGYYLTKKGNKVSYNPYYLKQSIHILDIKEDEFIGKISEFKLFIINEKNEIALILPIKTY